MDWVYWFFLILLAYFLNISNKLSTNDLMYTPLNLVGTGYACTASILLKYIPFILLEGAWALVSSGVLIKKHFKNQ
ncbi:CBU_0592 family membrane protein [Aquimarina algiphila]|uniref:CBU_0592 family membrane protein n=1 Tax=Aquimarina algiphila TaxID=2047982 RepID=UPI003A5C88EC